LQTITTENELAGKDNKYDLKAKVKTTRMVCNECTQALKNAISAHKQIAGKYKHGRTGFSVDKLQLKETGGLVGEFSLANVAPGLVFTFKVRLHPPCLLCHTYVCTCTFRLLTFPRLPIYLHKQGEDKPTGELGVEYTTPRLAFKAEADLVQLAKAKASAVVAHEGGKVCMSVRAWVSVNVYVH
jgi:hypothetical protein